MALYAIARACSIQLFLVAVFNLITEISFGKKKKKITYIKYYCWASLNNNITFKKRQCCKFNGYNRKMKLKILKALNKFYFHILTSTSFGCYVSKYRISPFLCFRSYAAYDYLRLPVKIKTIPVLNTTPSIFDFFFLFQVFNGMKEKFRLSFCMSIN